jgi:hypothetical protein
VTLAGVADVAGVGRAVAGLANDRVEPEVADELVRASAARSIGSPEAAAACGDRRREAGSGRCASRRSGDARASHGWRLSATTRTVLPSHRTPC